MSWIFTKFCILFFQGRCNREKPPCKYFHPPQHLKDQLLINGRNHLALKNALMQQMGYMSQPFLAGAGQFPSIVSVLIFFTCTLETTVKMHPLHHGEYHFGKQSNDLKWMLRFSLAYRLHDMIHTAWTLIWMAKSPGATSDNGFICKKINESLNIKEKKKSCEPFWKAALTGYGLSNPANQPISEKSDPDPSSVDLAGPARRGISYPRTLEQLWVKTELGLRAALEIFLLDGNLRLPIY